MWSRCVIRVNRKGGYLSTDAKLSNNGTVQYQFDWGDGNSTEWISNGANGDSSILIFQEYAWETPGIYEVKVRARSTVNNAIISQWSPPFNVIVSDTIINDSLIILLTPPKPRGENSIFINEEMQYESNSVFAVITANNRTDTIHVEAEYSFDWGDSSQSTWSVIPKAPKSWIAPGVYQVTIQARIKENPQILSARSEALIVTVQSSD
ncbi:MAG: hypothetical protein GY870_11130 [archaeon]|nr:hypothetical protein [archaeon]